MKKRQIGRTDLRVNEIGYGMMDLSNDATRRPSESEAINLLQRAVDEYGVEFFDTADAYGAGEDEMNHGERLISKALTGGRRERVVIATKGGFTRPGGSWVPNGRPEHLRAACEASLRALETDRIDLYQLHRPDPQVPLQESVGALADLQREGKIRAVGVSNVPLPLLIEAQAEAEIASVQNPLAFIYFNPTWPAMLDHCEKEGISMIAYAPVGGHRNAHRLVEFRDWLEATITSTNASPYGVALAWLLHRSPSIIPIPATKKIEHLAENMQAGDITLTPEEVEKLHYPESWMTRYARAKQEQNYPKAIEELNKGLAFDPTDGSTWYNLACVHALSGRPDDAFESIDRAIGVGFHHVDHARNEADFAALRHDPRFEKAMERMAVKAG